MKTVLIAAALVAAAQPALSATAKYSLDWVSVTPDTSSTLKGFVEFDLTAKTIVDFDLELVFSPSGLAVDFDRSAHGAPGYSVAPGSLAIRPGPTYPTTNYYGFSSYYTGTGFQFSNNTITEIGIYSGPLQQHGYTIGNTFVSAYTSGAQFLDYIGFYGSRLYSGDETLTANAATCHNTWWAYNSVYGGLVASYDRALECAYFSGTMTPFVEEEENGNGGTAPAVPLPAGLPLLAGALGLLALRRRPRD
ncbi:hypothetical protein GCM10011360_26750 [Primorskyibacter flagellatus]|uniref:VPLPA-CTERM protein sorting domain-containing protein n=1 Tax=Primorskyibacter flagellatus TaxID=1387277 RepID=A0A917AA96_9RHOB|nr:hypothetical protein [Primorskyibacter flagellatus]GGE37607.1 hypothetical protein GCM10011360_26750 [Primorskyibacter flagellatus]